MSKLITCKEFGGFSDYVSLAPGEYDLAYHDSSHLQQGDWQRVLSIEVQQPPHRNPFADAERSLTIRERMSEWQDEALAASVKDVVALSLARVGLLQPSLPSDIFEEVQRLHTQDGIVLIPDSNSLYNGSLHWLLRVLRESTVWILPFVVSLTQIQERDARLKSLVRSGPNKSGRQALRLRATINASLSLLQRYKSQYQVLELDPSLLRYLKLSPSDGEGNVLEDRLLIEGVHAVLRATRTRATQVVVTSDVLLARILEAEGIKHLFLPTPQLPSAEFSNVRYDSLARAFAGAPLRVLLWDLAHALSSIRCKSTSESGFQLSCYWPGKTPEDWRVERLKVEATAANGVAPMHPAVEEEAPKREGADPAEPAPEGETTTKAKREKKSAGAARIGVGTKATGSDAYLPRASLLQTLKIGGVVRRARQGDLQRIVSSIPEGERPTAEIARRALQILTKIGAVLHEGSEYLATSVLDGIDDALRAEDLDTLHRAFLSFPPYHLVANVLTKQGALQRAAVEPLLREAADTGLNTDAASRLPRFHVLLGQAWSDGDVIRNGSARPSDTDFERGFATAFDETQQDGFASVEALMPALCRELTMSPWAVQRYTLRMRGMGGLARFALQPAAGRPPIVRDKIVSGSLDEVLEVPVPMDRLLIGGRPIFTVGRGPR